LGWSRESYFHRYGGNFYQNRAKESLEFIEFLEFLELKEFLLYKLSTL
jgi:hypothetical protein